MRFYKSVKKMSYNQHIFRMSECLRKTGNFERWLLTLHPEKFPLHGGRQTVHSALPMEMASSPTSYNENK